jgi:hypothetical protein
VFIITFIEIWEIGCDWGCLVWLEIGGNTSQAETEFIDIFDLLDGDLGRFNDNANFKI